MSGEKVLVVEDEEDIQELIRYNLARESYKVTCVASGEEAYKTAATLNPDLMILDLMLPGVDGLEVCRTIKADPSTRHIPIVMVTAKGEESDVVSGLELGAEDYVTKPFSPKVLISRIRTVLRRGPVAAEQESGVIVHKDLTLHSGRHEVLVQNQPVDLTFTEFGILRTLVRRPGWVFTRSQIVDAVRGDNYAVTDRSVDFQIVGLRRKLGPCADYIQTVRGVGYRFQD